MRALPRNNPETCLMDDHSQSAALFSASSPQESALARAHAEERPSPKVTPHGHRTVA